MSRADDGCPAAHELTARSPDFTTESACGDTLSRESVKKPCSRALVRVNIKHIVCACQGLSVGDGSHFRKADIPFKKARGATNRLEAIHHMKMSQASLPPLKRRASLEI